MSQFGIDPLRAIVLGELPATEVAALASARGGRFDDVLQAFGRRTSSLPTEETRPTVESPERRPAASAAAKRQPDSADRGIRAHRPKAESAEPTASQRNKTRYENETESESDDESIRRGDANASAEPTASEATDACSYAEACDEPTAENNSEVMPAELSGKDHQVGEFDDPEVVLTAFAAATVVGSALAAADAVTTGAEGVVSSESTVVVAALPSAATDGSPDEQASTDSSAVLTSLAEPAETSEAPRTFSVEEQYPGDESSPERSRSRAVEVMQIAKTEGSQADSADPALASVAVFDGKTATAPTVRSDEHRRNGEQRRSMESTRPSTIGALEEPPQNMVNNAQLSQPSTSVSAVAISATVATAANSGSKAGEAALGAKGIDSATAALLGGRSEGTSTQHIGSRLSSPGSADPAATPEATTAAERARFVQRVAGAFRALNENNPTLRLRLSPPELGSLRIEITVRQGRMSARLEAESVEARNLLLDNLPALKERLAQQEIRVEQFQVDIADRQPHGGSPQAGSDSGQRWSPRSAAAIAATTEGAAPNATAEVVPLPSNHGDGRLNVIV